MLLLLHWLFYFKSVSLLSIITRESLEGNAVTVLHFLEPQSPHVVFCSAPSTTLKIQRFRQASRGPSFNSVLVSYRLHRSKRQRWLHVGSMGLCKQPKLNQSFMAISNSPAPRAGPWVPSHATSPYRRGTAHKLTLSMWHIPAPTEWQGMREEGRGDMQTVTNSLGIFHLGNRSSFTVVFLRDIQRVFRDLQSVLWSSKTECRESRSYLLFFFFWMMGSCSRIVGYRGVVNA